MVLDTAAGDRPEGGMLLEVANLRASYRSAGGPVRAVDDVSFALGRNQNLGLVGESGCGKTTLAKSLLRLHGPSVELGGEIRLDGQDLLKLSSARLNEIRWRRIAMVTQSAMNALNPVKRISEQMAETFRAHTSMSRSAARERARELFELVQLDENRLPSYPHQLSGGMRQRAVIAIALALEPDIIVADEPTTALDVVVQAEILQQMLQIKERLGTSMLLVTHDIGVVAQTCQRVAVMYAGKIVEVGEAHDVLTRALHPYTMGLQNAFPTVEGSHDALVTIPGSPPSLSDPPPGCRFAPRCPFATDLCRTQEPELLQHAAGHHAACHYADNAAEMRRRASEPSTWLTDDDGSHARPPAAGAGDGGAPVAKPVVAVRDLHRRFPLRRGLSSVLRRERPVIRAVDGVTLEVARGEILGLAGQSGSGKTTLSELIVGLQAPTSGQLTYGGRLSGKRTERNAFRRTVQMVFQDPYETLNPRHSVLRTVLEPLRNLGIGTPPERPGMVLRALTVSGLTPAEQFLDQLPHELSGGQRQRVALARAIVVGPELLVADEPVSMLDVSIRAAILNLLRRLRDEAGMSILYISHDLATIRYLCDRTAVMFEGRIVEVGPTADVIDTPQDPYTRLLVSSTLSPIPPSVKTGPH